MHTSLKVLILSMFSCLAMYAQEFQISDSSHNAGNIETSPGVMLIEEDFNTGHVHNLFQLIQGRIAGLSVSGQQSNPNGFFEIRSRGLRTLRGNTMPLMVIDGVRDAYPENLDPGDIESVTLISDASTTSFYGLRGGAGVLILETKKGRNGKPVFRYSTRVTAERIAQQSFFMDAAEWRSLSEEAGIGTDWGEETDWPAEITRTAWSQVHNFSVTGGRNLTQYRASVNYRNSQGIQMNTGYSGINGRFSLSQGFFKEKLSVGLNGAANQRKSHFGFSDAFKYALLSNPTTPVKDQNSSIERYDGYFQQILFDYYNPVQIVSSNRNEGLSTLTNISANVSYLVLKGLTFNAMYSIQQLNLTGVQYFDADDPWGGLGSNGYGQRQEHDAGNRQFSASVNYFKNVGTTARLNISAGYTKQKFALKGNEASKDNLTVEDLSFKKLFDEVSFKNGLTTTALFKKSQAFSSYFGMAGISNDFLFVRINGRYDAASEYSDNRKMFGGISAGIDFAEMFRKDAGERLVLRLGYGFAGNLPYPSYLSLYRHGTTTNILYNGYSLRTNLLNINPELKSEVISEFNAAIDFSLFNSIFSGSVVFYSASVKDPVMEIQVPVPPNLYPVMLVNLGKIKDSGLELILNGRFKRSDWTYNLSVNASYTLLNKIVSLHDYYNGALLTYGPADLGNLGSPNNNQTPLIRLEEGKPFGQLLALDYEGIDENGFVRCRDINRDGTIDYEDRIVAANALPKALLSIANSFRYNNWDLNFVFRGVFGHHLVNTYRALYEAPLMISTYNLPQTAANQRNSESGAFRNSNLYTDHAIENASFLCLDNLSVGFTVPALKGNHSKIIRFYLAANNLFYLTGYSGMDPNPRYGDFSQYSGAYDPLIPGAERINTWYRTRSFSAGAGVTF